MLTLSAPTEVTVEVTNRCNLKCVHCFSLLDRDNQERILSTQELLELGDQLARSRVFTVVFSGGEPLLRPSFLQVASYYNDLGLDVGFSTNGTLVTDTIAGELAERGLGRGVQVSLDGACPLTHEQIRGAESYQHTLRGIRALVAASIRPSLGVTVMRDNIHEAREIVELARREGCRHVHFIFLMPAGGALQASSRIQPSATSVAKFAEELEAIRIAAAPDVTIDWANATHCPTGGPLHEETYSAVDQAFAGCPAGKVSVCIDAFGNVLGCDILRGPEFIAGSIRETSFESIWVESPVLHRWRMRDSSTIQGKCQTCRFLFACVGGCPAFSVAEGGDIFQGDPTCLRVRSVSS